MFFFKQKTAYELRISDWSSDVCSSDLRAAICERPDIPPDVVTMGSSVTFIDEKSRAERTMRLVYPAEADIAEGRMSILTPVGAGLLGLSVGQSINWPDRGGIEHRLQTVAANGRAARRGGVGVEG